MERTIVFVYFCIITVIYIEAGDVANDSNKTLTGKALFDLGNRYNKPMLRLIGKSLMNLECERFPCSEWSEWSACKLFVGQFGAKSRTRICGGTASNGCRTRGEPMTESESVICQEFCPSNYEMVHGKYCLWYHNDSRLDKKTSERTCRSEGGYLININTPEKWSAFESMFEKYTISSAPYIDGQRKDSGSPWTYSYESDITGYSNWYINEPSNKSYDLCMVAYVHSGTYTGMGKYDAKCTDRRYFMCEIVPK